MSRCKYYVNGICYSPYTVKTFGEPSSEPVDPAYCLTDRFKECRYYVEGPSSSAHELEETLTGGGVLEFYPKIHLIPCDLVSQCPFYETRVIDKEKSLCVARCTIFDKFLTKSSVKKCIDYWKECPFYKAGLEITT